MQVGTEPKRIDREVDVEDFFARKTDLVKSELQAGVLGERHFS